MAEKSGSELSRIAKTIVRLDPIFTFVATNLAVACYIIMLLFILFGIVMRFILRQPNVYGEEISLLCMYLGVCLGIALGIRSRSHLGVDSFIHALPPNAKKVISIIVNIIIICTYVLLAYVTFRLCSTSFQTKTATSALHLPYYVIYLMMFICYALCILQQILMFSNDFLLKKPVLVEKGAGLIE